MLGSRLIAAVSALTIVCSTAAASTDFFNLSSYPQSFQRNANRMPLPSTNPFPYILPIPTPLPPSSPHIYKPSSTNVYTESPTFTGGSYRVSGNNVQFPKDLSDTFNRAKAERKPLDVFAIHISFDEQIVGTGIPELRIFAHTCTLPYHDTYLSMYGSNDTPTPKKGFPNMTPPKAPSGANGGNVYIVCINVIRRKGILHVRTKGKAGGYGGTGGDGSNGVDGTPSERGDCKFKWFKCRRDYGKTGRLSTSGRDGARGGSGGDGGNGGDFSLYYINKSPELETTPTHVGGYGTLGGPGGNPGKNGRVFEPIHLVSGCKSICREVRVLETGRVPLRTSVRGNRGYNGRTGNPGTVDVKQGLSSVMKSFSVEDILRFYALAERYYNDLVIGKASCPEAISVMNTVSLLSKVYPTVPVLNSIAQRAQVNMKGVQLRKNLFGPATLARSAPTTIGDELFRSLRYAKAINEQMNNMQLETNLVSIITKTTAISIPATNFNVLRADLMAQRNTFQRGVEDVERSLSSSRFAVSDAIQAYIRKLKEEAEKRKAKAIIKGVLSIVSIASGLIKLDFNQVFQSANEVIGSIGDIDISLSNLKETVEGFKKVKKEFDEVKDLVEEKLNLKGNVKNVKNAINAVESKSSSCNLQEIKELMNAAPDRTLKFPNLVDFGDDFSEIEDIGVIAELSNARLGVRSSKLSGQIACLFGAKLEDIPTLRSAFDNFFILTGSRIDILSRMVDIDIELRQLRVSEEGIQSQKRALQHLEGEIGRTSPSNLLVSLSISFEQARMQVIKNIERLASSYSNIALRPMSEDIQEYASRRLRGNGAFGFSSSVQYVNLARLEDDVKSRFNRAHGCTTKREIPAPAYFSFDLTQENSPAVFSGGIRTGPKNRTALVLDINDNCAFYANSRPATRGLEGTNPRSQCIPNKVKFNSRMVSISVELLGGDDSKLPSGWSSVFTNIEQVGFQSFNAKPGLLTGFEVEPLRIGMGSIRLRSGGPSDVLYNPTCTAEVGGLGTVNLDSPRVCPSPFSTYFLQIGLSETAQIHEYLDTVSTIRIHTRLVSFCDERTARVCFTA